MEWYVREVYRPRKKTREAARLVELPPQDDLPPGRTWKCAACGTRVRAGQPHSALRPYPHQTLGALAVSR